MPRKGTTQQTKTVLRHQCGACNEIFTGKMCPSCGEKVNLFPINADGIPMDDVASAVGATHGLPINLSRSPELFDADEVIDTAMKQQMRDVIQDANLDKVKTLAADQAAKRIRAEEELEATKKGFIPPEPGAPQQEDQSGFASINPAMMMQMLGGWEPEQREHFLNYLNANPMTALHLSMMMNPGKAGGMNQMGAMNPYAMMGGMMQPPVEQAPQADAATMLTAVVSAVQTMKEMGGGDDGNNKQMERLLDKMDDMRKETEDLKLQLVEERNHKTGISSEEVRIIIADALARSSEQRANIQEGVAVLNDLKNLKSGMVDLGLMQEVNSGDQKPSIEERQLDHQIKMDEKREARDHEIRLATEKSEQAAAETKGAFINGLFAAANEQKEHTPEDNDENEKVIDVPKVESRPAAVIS